ncbi:hypothetical protein [Aureibacter tunicatorum]|uniref:Uncharacterized protein n=1 Tax=Aureibacter tunicatorum TaxID=866807 RepID=A0AAE3XLE0_9BACT|nr:hypothetical protein [Aureibacter tunicatorum]MDR6237916.1 hypothetical protein [Aureibacter tunicatorum]BDD02949.1 hypothetical protein AUTU_04320 [Aureibacter tunicatorum]
MKKLTLILFFFASMTSLFAQTAYDEAMQKGLKIMKDFETLDEMKEMANHFERISMKEANDWLPAYYVAWAKIMSTNMGLDKDLIDPTLDDAQKYIDKARTNDGDEAELNVLEAWLNQCRIQVSPMMRGAKYSGKARDILEATIKSSPQNPRASHLLGMNYYYTPSFFGGGCKPALPHLQKADELFESFSSTEKYFVNWGGKNNKSIIQKCH